MKIFSPQKPNRSNEARPWPPGWRRLERAAASINGRISILRIGL